MPMWILLAAATLLLEMTFADGRSQAAALLLGVAALLAAFVAAALAIRRSPGRRAAAVVATMWGLVLSADVARRAPFAIAILLEQGDQVVIPANHAGWCRIVYGVPGAPPLPRRGQWRVIAVPGSGEVATSDPAPERGREIFVHDRAAGRSAAHVVNRFVEVRESVQEYLFVGTDADFRAAQQASGFDPRSVVVGLAPRVR